MPRDLRVNVGTAGILTVCNRVLCLRRHPDHSHRPGEWSFPGGWLDFGETPERGIEREFEEEVGVSVQAEKLLTANTATYPDPERHIVTLFYAVWYSDRNKSLPRNMEPEKHDLMEWLTWEELRDGRPLMPPVQQYVDSGVAVQWLTAQR